MEKWNEIYLSRPENSKYIFIYFNHSLFLHQSRKLICYPDNSIVKIEDRFWPTKNIDGFMVSSYGKDWNINGKIFNL